MACWDGYKQVGMKKKGNKMVPNCVEESVIDKMAEDNTCVNCGNIVTENILDENLKKWFSDKWVNIGKKDKSGKHPPCGTSGKKRGYAKCVPKSKAGSMSKKEKESATRRKRAAQNKAGRGGTSDVSGGGKKPIRVKTKAESVMNLSKEKLIEMIKEEYQNILSEKSAISLNLWVKEFERLAKKKKMNPVDYMKMHMEKRKGSDILGGVLKDVLKHFQKNEMMTEAQFDEAAGKKDACYSKVKARYDVWPSAYASGALVKCRKVGAKNWGNKSKKEVKEDNIKLNKKDMDKLHKGEKVSKNGDEIEYDVVNEQDYKDFTSYMKENYSGLEEGQLEEAEYQGRKVKLGKPMQGDSKKFKVYVKNPKGNVVKVNFGQKGMNIKKDNPGARKSFRARHKCDQDKPRTSAGYWSCRKW